MQQYLCIPPLKWWGRILKFLFGDSLVVARSIECSNDQTIARRHAEQLFEGGEDLFRRVVVQPTTPLSTPSPPPLPAPLVYGDDKGVGTTYHLGRQ